MSAKKKKTTRTYWDKLKPLWKKYRYFIVGAVLLLLILLTTCLADQEEQAPEAQQKKTLSVIEKAGGNLFRTEIITLAENSAVLNMVGDGIELNGVVLRYSPESLKQNEVERMVISSIRFQGDLAGAVRKFFAFLNAGTLKCTGPVLINELICGDLRYENVELTPDPKRAWKYARGTMKNATVEIDSEKNFLHVKGKLPGRFSLLYPGKSTLIGPALWTMLQKQETKDAPSVGKEDQAQVDFQLQELRLSLAEEVHPWQRVEKLHAPNFVTYDAATGELTCTRHGNTLNAKLSADTDTADFEIHAPHRKNFVYKGKYQRSGTVTGKGSAEGGAHTLAGDAKKMTVDFGDGFQPVQVSAVDYREKRSAFTLSAPLYVSRSGGLDLKKGTLALTGTDLTAGDVSVQIASDKTGGVRKGTFSLGTVLKNGRKIGSVSGTIQGETLSGKANLYGLEQGVLTGKLIRNGEKLEYTITFPRQQIKNAGKDLLPEKSPVRLQGFAGLKMDHTGAFDLVIDNSELDLVPVKLSNFSMDTRTRDFSFDSASLCGFTFTKGQGKYHWKDGKICLDGLNVNWCGGKCSLQPRMEEGKYVLDCTDLLLPDLFKVLRLGTFTGTGRVSGKIPLTIEPNGTLKLGEVAFYSMPGDSETLQGTLKKTSAAADVTNAFMMDVMCHMKYDWIKLDLAPEANENGKYMLGISFCGKAHFPLKYELVTSGGDIKIQRTETANNLPRLNLSLSLELELGPAVFRDLFRNLLQ